MVLALSVWSGAQTLLSARPGDADSDQIVAVHENGHIVYTNFGRPAPVVAAVSTHHPSLRPAAVVRRHPAPPAHLDRIMQRAATRYAVDPLLVREVARQESGFDTRSVSDKGALGVMQLMPQTARALGVQNPFDPQQNIEGGTRYLRDLLALYHGSVPLSLAAYNAGPGAVAKYGNRVPPYHETQQYVNVITRRYAGAAASSTSSDTAELVPAPIIVRTQDADGHPIFTDAP